MLDISTENFAKKRKKVVDIYKVICYNARRMFLDVCIHITYIIWKPLNWAIGAVGVVHDLICNITMNEVKHMYLNAEMDVVKFSVEDVIATSPADTTTSSNKGGLGGENEGPAGDSFL